MPRRPHDIYIRTIGGTDIGFMLSKNGNGRRSYSVVDAQTIAPRFLTEEQVSQQQLPPDLALTFPQTSWHRGIGGLLYKASDPDVLADGTRIDVTERGVIKLARETVASTVDSVPNEYVPSGFAISGTQARAFIGRDVYSWDWTNDNWDIETEPVAAARIFRNAVPFDGRLYVPSWADDVGSGGSYVAADEPVNYLYKLISDAGWSLIANSGQTLEGPKYMAVADQKLWGGYWASAADSGIDIAGPSVDATTNSINNAATQNLTVAHTTAGDNRGLVVLIAQEDAGGAPAAPTDVTYGGVSMTQESTQTDGANVRVSLYSLINPASGNNNVVVTQAASIDQLDVSIVSLNGVNQSNMIDTVNSVTGTATSSSIAHTTVTNDIVFDVIGIDAGGSAITMGGGQTSMFQDTLNEHAGSREAAAGASTTMSWTWTTSVTFRHTSGNVKGGITASQTIIRVTGTPSSQFVAGDVVKIESELMLVTAVSDAASTITVVRGYRGSAGATHVQNTDIYEITENPHHVRSSTNGSSYANWSTATAVGDSGSAITALVSSGEQLVVIKTDGIYTLEVDGTVTNHLPGGPQMGHANFGKGAWAWNNLVFIPLQGGGLWELETETWTIRDISFSISMPDQTQYHGRVVAGGGDPSRLYVLVQETANTRYHVMMSQNPAQAGISDYNWTEIGAISYTTGTDPDHAALLLTALTNGSNTHHRLWVGVESTGSSLLPRFITVSDVDDDDEYTATDGEAYTVAFDAGFPNVLKRAQNIVCNTDNLGAVGGTNNLIHVRYRVDGGSWLYVHTGTGTNTADGSTLVGDNQTIAFSAGVTFRKIELRFTHDRKTTGDGTTPELHDFTLTCQLRTSALKLLPLSCYLANGLRLRNGMIENRALPNRNQLRTWNAQGAEIVLTDNEGGTRNCLMLPGRMRETEVAAPFHGFPEYVVEFILAEVG